MKADLRLPALELLPVGSYLSLVTKPTLHDKARNKLIAAARAGGRLDPAQAMRVRPSNTRSVTATATVVADRATTGLVRPEDANVQLYCSVQKDAVAQPAGPDCQSH